MKNKISVLFAVTCFCFELSYGQNIAINTSGTAAAATNMFEVTQTSAAANMVAIYAINSGATAGTGYGLYSTKTGAGTTNVAGYFSATGGTNNYAGIFDQGNVGIGNTAPGTKLVITSNSTGGLQISGPATGGTGNGVTNGILQVRDNDDLASPVWPGGAHIVIWPSGTGLGIL